MKSHTELLNRILDALYAAPLSPEIHPYQMLAAEIRGQMQVTCEPCTKVVNTKPPVSYIREAKEWIKHVSGQVTILDFAEWLKAKHPNAEIKMSSLNNPIRKLVKDGELEVSHTGSGRTPSVYTTHYKPL